MGRLWFGLFFCALLLPCRVDADFYRYRDRSGAIRFTDNIAEVPPEQRKEIKSYEDAAKTATETQQDENSAAAASADAEKTAADAGKDAGEPIAAQLHQRQQALNQEYEALQKERAALQQPAGQRVNPTEQEKYTKAVEALNAKITDYQQRRNVYENDVKAHNEKMKSQTAPNPESTRQP